MQSPLIKLFVSIATQSKTAAPYWSRRYKHRSLCFQTREISNQNHVNTNEYRDIKDKNSFIHNLSEICLKGKIVFGRVSIQDAGVLGTMVKTVCIVMSYLPIFCM